MFLISEFGGEASMEFRAVTDLQPFNSRYHSEQACMEALIAMKWPNGFPLLCPRPL